MEKLVSCPEQLIMTPNHPRCNVCKYFWFNTMENHLIVDKGKTVCWQHPLTLYIWDKRCLGLQLKIRQVSDSKRITIHPLPVISSLFWPNDLTSLPGKSLIATLADASNTQPPLVVNKPGTHQRPGWNEMFWAAESCREPLWGVMMWCYDEPWPQGSFVTNLNVVALSECWWWRASGPGTEPAMGQPRQQLHTAHEELMAGRAGALFQTRAFINP